MTFISLPERFPHACGETGSGGTLLGDAVRACAFGHRRVVAGKRLIHGGQPFESLYLVHAGFFKTVAIDDAGNEQVLGFPMRGDLIGTDGIGRLTHYNEVVALTAAEVIVIPFLKLNELARLEPGLDEALFFQVSQQLVRDQLALAAVTALSSESRIAGFLLRFGARMKRHGFSERSFILPMSRADIGLYLGIKIETVSRGFSGLANRGLIAVDQRAIDILDAPALAAVHHDGRIRKPAQSTTMHERSTGAEVI